MKRLDQISFGRIVQIREHLIGMQRNGKKVFRLESGDPSFDVAPHILEAMGKAMKDGKTHYVPNDGIPELRNALSEKLFHQNKIQCAPHDIFVTNGAMHALHVTFRCLLEEGDEVIVPEPLWTEIGENIRLAGGVLNSVPLRKENNYQYRVEDIAARITSKTKIIFINSPHNPTGAVQSKEELKKIAELAEERSLWLVSDEAYEDLIFEGEHFSPASAIQKYSKTVSIYSFSKSYAMSGLRVGYIASKEPHFQTRVQKLLRCTVNGINSVSQWGALAAVTGPRDHLNQMLEEYRKRREIIFQQASQIPGLNPFNPQGGFYLWCEIEEALLKKLGKQNASQISDILAESGIGSAPGETFGCTYAHAIRFAFSCSTEMVKEGIDAVRKILAH